MPTFPTPTPITARLDLVAGDARLVASERDTTTVEVTPADPSNKDDVKVAELVRVEYAAGELLVKAPKLRSWRPRGAGGSVRVLVELPAGSRVSAHGQLTDFHCSGPLGDCDVRTGLGHIAVEQGARVSLRTGMGDITVDHALADAEITTASGGLRLAHVDGTAVLKNSNGDTWVGTADGDLRARAANGRIGVDVANASVEAKSANGALRVGDAVRGAVTLRTSVGDIEVGIREGAAAWLEVNAVTGRVRNELTPASAPPDTTDTLEVRARTTAGDVLVRRP